MMLEYISDMDRRRQLAAAVKRSPDYLWQVATGRRSASAKLAKAIDEATDGQVPKHALRSDVFDPPKEVA